MRPWRILLVIVVGAPSVAALLPAREPWNVGPDRVAPPKIGLDARVETFDSAGRSLVQCVLDLAYDYHLPMGLEYVDRKAVKQGLSVKTHGATVRQVLTSVMAGLPEYRVDFSNGVVQIYSPKARRDASNLLNTFISDFEVRNVDTREADFQLFVTLGRKHGRGAAVGSIAVGAWGTRNITLHLRGAKVYEILNAIVAANGQAVWTVRVPPEKLSVVDGTMWYIYGLDPPWKGIVLRNVQALFPMRNSPD